MTTQKTKGSHLVTTKPHGECYALILLCSEEAGTRRDIITQLEREGLEIKEPASEVMFLAMLAYSLVKARLPVLKERGFIRKVESQTGSWQTCSRSNSRPQEKPAWYVLSP